MKVVSIVGARPQFVKAFSVSRTLRRHHTEILVHTGQHYDEKLSDIFFNELGLPSADFNLGIGSASHAEQTAEMLLGLKKVINPDELDVMLVYGDTNSTLAGAILSSKLNLRLAHVEAGLRSFNRSMPEEINRVLTDHVSDILFAPSETAVSNLRREGIHQGVYNTGDVMYDTTLWARQRAREFSDILSELDLKVNRYIVVTVHRASNTDDSTRLKSIIDALIEIPYPVIFPVHPRTANRLKSYGLWERADDELKLIDPVGYFDFIRLLDEAAAVLTDSGGVQKEAFFLRTMCITLREETEWIETVESGWNTVVGTDKSTILKTLSDIDTPESRHEPYGAGDAAERIVSILESATRN